LTASTLPTGAHLVWINRLPKIARRITDRIAARVIDGKATSASLQESSASTRQSISAASICASPGQTISPSAYVAAAMPVVSKVPRPSANLGLCTKSTGRPTSSAVDSQHRCAMAHATIDPACPSECQCRHGQSRNFARSDLKVDCRAIS
jgi:hypothetical protein